MVRPPLRAPCPLTTPPARPLVARPRRQRPLPTPPVRCVLRYLTRSHITHLLQPSHSASPDHEEPLPSISISTAFYPGSHPLGCDLIFTSSDKVLFYVHTNAILKTSKHAFQNVTPLCSSSEVHDPIINIPETSIVLDVILHILYSIPCANHAPTFDTLLTAVNRMPIYAIAPKVHIIPSNPCYAYLLAFAPLFPLEVYTLAAHFDMTALAAAASSHLLSYPLATIDDATAERMGPVYLKRLMFLHANRVDALKGILLSPPHPHPTTKSCDFTAQKNLTRAWALVSAQLAWDARPGPWRL